MLTSHPSQRQNFHQWDVPSHGHVVKPTISDSIVPYTNRTYLITFYLLITQIIVIILDASTYNINNCTKGGMNQINIACFGDAGSYRN